MSIASQWRRIAAKPPRELAARAAAVVQDRLERRRHASGRLSPEDRLARALGTARVDAVALLSARRAKRPPFFPSVLQRDAIRLVVNERYRAELDDMRIWAARANDHQFHFFGRTHVCGPDIDWHADPVTGQAWPQLFYEDAYGSATAKSCDVKDVWELSRQQCLIDLGKSYFLDGAGAHAAAARRTVRVLSAIGANRLRRRLTGGCTRRRTCRCRRCGPLRGAGCTSRSQAASWSRGPAGV